MRGGKNIRHEECDEAHHRSKGNIYHRNGVPSVIIIIESDDKNITCAPRRISERGSETAEIRWSHIRKGDGDLVLDWALVLTDPRMKHRILMLLRSCCANDMSGLQVTVKL